MFTDRQTGSRRNRLTDCIDRQTVLTVGQKVLTDRQTHRQTDKLAKMMKEDEMRSRLRPSGDQSFQ